MGLLCDGKLAVEEASLTAKLGAIATGQTDGILTFHPATPAHLESKIWGKLEYLIPHIARIDSSGGVLLLKLAEPKYGIRGISLPLDPKAQVGQISRWIKLVEQFVKTIANRSSFGDGSDSSSDYFDKKKIVNQLKPLLAYQCD